MTPEELADKLESYNPLFAVSTNPFIEAAAHLRRIPEMERLATEGRAYIAALESQLSRGTPAYIAGLEDRLATLEQTVARLQDENTSMWNALQYIVELRYQARSGHTAGSMIIRASNTLTRIIKNREGECRETFGEISCSREPGHGGRHVAKDGTEWRYGDQHSQPDAIGREYYKP